MDRERPDEPWSDGENAPQWANIAEWEAERADAAEAENARLRALVSVAVEMLAFEYTAGDGVPEKFSAEWDLLLRQVQEGLG